MTDATAATPPRRQGSVLVALLRRPRSAFGLVVILTMVGAAVFAPWLMPYDPNDQMFDGLSLEGAPLPPSSEFWLGTDLLGRDLFSRRHCCRKAACDVRASFPFRFRPRERSRRCREH